MAGKYLIGMFLVCCNEIGKKWERENSLTLWLLLLLASDVKFLMWAGAGQD
jgi:hypothetical protein